MEKSRVSYDISKEKENCFKITDLAIGEKDLISIGYKPGPEMGEILKDLFEKVVDCELENDKDVLIDYVETQAALGCDTDLERY